MASGRVVVASHDAGGTVPPMLALAETFVSRGVEVAWLGQPSIEQRAVAAGCSFLPFDGVPNYAARVAIENQPLVAMPLVTGRQIGEQLLADWCCLAQRRHLFLWRQLGHPATVAAHFVGCGDTDHLMEASFATQRVAEESVLPIQIIAATPLASSADPHESFIGAAHPYEIGQEGLLREQRQFAPRFVWPDPALAELGCRILPAAPTGIGIVGVSHRVSEHFQRSGLTTSHESGNPGVGRIGAVNNLILRYGDRPSKRLAPGGHSARMCMGVSHEETPSRYAARDDPQPLCQSRTLLALV